MLTGILIGLSIGMLLLLMAAGLTLIFGMLGVVNFAHGSLYMLGAFAATLTTAHTGNLWLGLAVAAMSVALVGALLEVALLRPLYDRNHEQQLLMTFGLILVIEEAARWVWGLDYRSAPMPAMFASPLEWFGEKLPAYRVFVVVAGVVVAGGLYAFIERSQTGMVLRAAMSNAQMVRALGIRVSRYRTLMFALGAGLAGFGGAISAALLPVQTSMGFQVIIDCFVVVIIGGLGNIRGAIVAALALGQVQALGQLYFPEWVDLVIYTVLVVVLLVRPQGIFTFGVGRRA